MAGIRSDRPTRDFLLYCPTNGGRLAGDFLGGQRRYDVALHDYGSDAYRGPADVEYGFAGPGHKWPRIRQNLRRIAKPYDYYAFFDDDIEVTTDQVNELFLAGKRYGLKLFAPTLTRDSFGSHPRLFQRRLIRRKYRHVPFVELMMPFFERSALMRCEPTFDDSESGWGLDLLWGHLVGRDGVAVLDRIAVRHSRPVVSKGWKLENGKSAEQEMEEIIAAHDLDPRLLHRPLLFNVHQRWLRYAYFRRHPRDADRPSAAERP